MKITLAASRLRSLAPGRNGHASPVQEQFDEVLIPERRFGESIKERALYLVTLPQERPPAWFADVASWARGVVLSLSDQVATKRVTWLAREE